MPQYTSVQNRLSFILLWCCHVGHSFPSVQVVLQWPQSMPQLALFDLNIIITSNGICTTSEVILIVLLLYFLVPPTRDYIDINPWKNQCKPWGRLHKKNNKNKDYFISPQGKSAQSVRQVGPVREKVSFIKCINREARHLSCTLTHHKQVRLLKEKFATPKRSNVLWGFLLERFSSLSFLYYVLESYHLYTKVARFFPIEFLRILVFFVFCALSFC